MKITENKWVKNKLHKIFEASAYELHKMPYIDYDGIIAHYTDISKLNYSTFDIKKAEDEIFKYTKKNYPKYLNKEKRRLSKKWGKN